MNRKVKLVRIGVIVLAVCALIGVPWLLHAHKVSQRNACLNNLRQIDAVQTCCVPLENHLAFGDKMEPEECFQYIKAGKCPVCPAGGHYIISWVVGGPYPKCSVHGDLLQQLHGNRTFRDGIGTNRSHGARTASRDPMARRPRMHTPPEPTSQE